MTPYGSNRPQWFKALTLGGSYSIMDSCKNSSLSIMTSSKHLIWVFHIDSCRDSMSSSSVMRLLKHLLWFVFNDRLTQRLNVTIFNYNIIKALTLGLSQWSTHAESQCPHRHSWHHQSTYFGFYSMIDSCRNPMSPSSIMMSSKHLLWFIFNDRLMQRPNVTIFYHDVIKALTLGSIQWLTHAETQCHHLLLWCHQSTYFDSYSMIDSCRDPISPTSIMTSSKHLLWVVFNDRLMQRLNDLVLSDDIIWIVATLTALTHNAHAESKTYINLMFKGMRATND